MKKDKKEQAVFTDVLAGRSLDEQLEHVRNYQNHGVGPVLRGVLLEGLGIPKPRERAANFIMFGCYIPFMMPILVRDYIRLLDHLNVEYSYAENEFCCGSPMIRTNTGGAREKAKKAGKEFMGINRDAAEQKGATTLAYCCVACAHIAKGFFAHEAVRHVYLFDLLMESLEKQSLRVEPARVGYFEGCHTRYRAIFPEIDTDLGWGKYRRLLDKIEGLKIVDLPREICCTKQPDRILEAAEEQSLETIVCPCNGCYDRMSTKAKGRVKIKYLTEILLQSLSIE